MYHVSAQGVEEGMIKLMYITIIMFQLTVSPHSTSLSYFYIFPESLSLFRNLFFSPMVPLP